MQMQQPEFKMRIYLKKIESFVWFAEQRWAMGLAYEGEIYVLNRWIDWDYMVLFWNLLQ